jgi:hypothetical protein
MTGGQGAAFSGALAIARWRDTSANTKFDFRVAAVEKLGIDSSYHGGPLGRRGHPIHHRVGFLFVGIQK